MGLIEKARATIGEHDMLGIDAPMLLMVSGGSDSTAMAYIMAELREVEELADGHPACEPPAARRRC